MVDSALERPMLPFLSVVRVGWTESLCALYEDFFRASEPSASRKKKTLYMTFARGGGIEKKYSNGQKLASESLLVVYREFDRSSHQTNTVLDQIGIKENDKNVFNIIENIFFIFWNPKLKTSLNFYGFPSNHVIHFWMSRSIIFLKS